MIFWELLACHLVQSIAANYRQASPPCGCTASGSLGRLGDRAATLEISVGGLLGAAIHRCNLTLRCG